MWIHDGAIPWVVEADPTSSAVLTERHVESRDAQHGKLNGPVAAALGQAEAQRNSGHHDIDLSRSITDAVM